VYRSATTLGIEWTAPVEDGGTAVLDYRISKKEPFQNFEELASTSYPGLYVVSLDPGTIYTFIV
jgi:hypothetical protein